MLDSKLTKILSGCLLSMLGSGLVCAEDTVKTSQTMQVPEQAHALQGQIPPQTTVPQAAALSPEEIAYRTQMVALSNAIAAKIKEIQVKQKQIDSIIYPNDLPILQTEMAGLKKELEALNLHQQSLTADKTASDMNALLKQKQS